MGAMQRVMSFLGFDDEEDYDDAPEPEPRRRKTPILSLHTQRIGEIVVVQPRTLDDARDAADCLKKRRPLVVNLREADKELAQRIVDFLCGVDYALDGHLQRVGDDIFLFTPNHITITAEQSRTLESNRTIFPVS
ncbi:MAG: cell division protein SepF [Armatimonadetes bacterium]|nr:cell division protein SepF [Armatimonadota bacterium]